MSQRSSTRGRTIQTQNNIITRTRNSKRISRAGRGKGNIRTTIASSIRPRPRALPLKRGPKKPQGVSIKQKSKGGIKQVIPPKQISSIPKPQPKRIGIGQSFGNDFIKGNFVGPRQFIAFSPKSMINRKPQSINQNFSPLSQNFVNSNGFRAFTERKMGKRRSFTTDLFGVFS